MAHKSTTIDPHALNAASVARSVPLRPTPGNPGPTTCVAACAWRLTRRPVEAVEESFASTRGMRGNGDGGGRSDLVAERVGCEGYGSVLLYIGSAQVSCCVELLLRWLPVRSQRKVQRRCAFIAAMY